MNNSIQNSSRHIRPSSYRRQDSQQSVGTSTNKRTIQKKMLAKAKGKYSKVPDLTEALNKKTNFTDKRIDHKMEMVFKFKEGSAPSTETGEMGLKCFFLEQSLEAGSTTKEECIATCNALFDYVTNFETQGVFDDTMFGSALNLVGANIPQSSGRLNNSPKDLATKMHYFEDLLQRCDDQYPGAMEAVMTSKGMGYAEPASRPQQSRAIPTAGLSMADNAARHRLNISYEGREKYNSEQDNVTADFAEKYNSEQDNVTADFAEKYNSEQNELKNDYYYSDDVYNDIEEEFELSLEFLNKDPDPDDDEYKSKFKSERDQVTNTSRPDSPTGVADVFKAMSPDNAQKLIQTIFDEIVTDPVFKNRSSFQAVMDAFRKGTVFTNNNNGKRGKNETCGTNYLNKNHKQKIIDISNGTSKQSEGVQRICELFKDHAQELEQLIDSQGDLKGEKIYYNTSILKPKLSWVESSFVKNEIQVTTDSFILMAKVMINHESLEGSAAGNFAHRLSELVR